MHNNIDAIQIHLLPNTLIFMKQQNLNNIYETHIQVRI